MNDPMITVLLSTFNGERYLGAQLASLWAQTHQDFELVVRDDGSSDGTVSLLRAAKAERGAQVRFVEDDGGRLGPKLSFSRLLDRAAAPYVAFCDQDDHWLPHKLARILEAVQGEEARSGLGTPVLCCSDAVVSDAELKPLHRSYFARHNLSAANGRDSPLARLMFRNYAIGATTMINAALATRCRQIPDAAVMHDWWCALVATVTGRALVLPEALMLYRQHGANAIGSKRRAWPRSVAEFHDALNWSQSGIAQCVRQARALRQICDESVSAKDRALLDRFASFDEQSPLQRAATVLKCGAFKPGLALNSLHLLACMTAAVGSP